MKEWHCDICDQYTTEPGSLPIPVAAKKGVNIVALACPACRAKAATGQKTVLSDSAQVLWGKDVTDALIKRGDVDADGNWPPRPAAS